MDGQEIALIKALAKGSGGAAAGDYETLSNKPSINGNVLEGNMSAATLGIATVPSAANANIAADYDASLTYKVGDYCLYNGVLYVCTTAITTAEAWTAGHWAQTKTTDRIGQVNNLYTALDVTNISTFSWRAGYWNVSASTGEIAEMSEASASSSRLSDPIPVNAGDVVTASVKMYGNRFAIAFFKTADSTTATAGVVGVGANYFSTYTFTCPSAGYVCISSHKSDADSATVSITGQESARLLTIENKLLVLSDNGVYGVTSPGYCNTRYNATTAINPNNNSFAIELFMTLRDLGTTTGKTIAFTDSTVPGAGSFINVWYAPSTSVSNNLRVTVNGTQKGAHVIPGTPAHLVISYDRTAHTVFGYLNGVQLWTQDVTTISSSIKQSDALQSNDYCIYRRRRIYNRALTAAEVADTWNYGYPLEYIMPKALTDSLLSDCDFRSITTSGWKDTVTSDVCTLDDTVTFDTTYDHFSSDVTIPESQAAALSVQDVLYPDYETVTAAQRQDHDCTFIGNNYVSFNTAESANTSAFIDPSTWAAVKTFKLNLAESTGYALQMKSCDYKFGKLLVGNGRAINSNETSYTDQGAKLYVFYDAADWVSATETIDFTNCGNYDVVDVADLGYKIYGFWGQFDDCVFVSCNLFNDIYLIQLGTGTNDLGEGTYTAAGTGRYNGSYAILGHWSQDGQLGDTSAHGGQYYKGALYLASNTTTEALVYKCHLKNDGTLKFDAIRFDNAVATSANTKAYKYIDGVCIKNGSLYAQPLYEGSSYGSNTVIIAEL